MSTREAVQRGQARSGSFSPKLPLSALLSQSLLAYTIEFDNEFERATKEAGDHTGISLLFWPFAIRPVVDGAITLEEMAQRTASSLISVLAPVGAAARNGFVSLRPSGGSARRSQRASIRRDDIGGDSIVQLTERGAFAHETWSATSELIEARWRKRFGSSVVTGLRSALEQVADRIGLALPDFLELSIANRPPLNRSPQGPQYGPRVADTAKNLPLWTLLSRVLLWFRLEFDKERGPFEDLPTSANVLRVLTLDGVKAGELHTLTGGSRESVNSAFLARFGLADQAKDPTGRSKIIKLTPRGEKAQVEYSSLAGDIEDTWRSRYGVASIDKLRSSLESLFALQDRSGGLRMVEGLVPPEGTLRATGIWWGHAAPETGHSGERERDIVAQSEAWVRDPVASLPHYPLWNPTRAMRP